MLAFNDLPAAAELQTFAHSVDMRRLEHDLRMTTEHLARELIQAGKEAPQWDTLQWRVAMASCVIHGISALLHGKLRWRGPDIWEAFLREQAASMLTREGKVRSLLTRIDEQARREGVGLLGLKGSSMLKMDLYAPGLRPMADIDLLVRMPTRAAALKLLQRVGYKPEFDGPRDFTLFDQSGRRDTPHLGEHPENPVDVELHSRICEQLGTEDIDITHRLAPSTWQPGLNGYPDLPALMQHLLLHAAGNLRNRSMRLIQLHDIARLAAHMTTASWRATGVGTQEEPAWWAFPVLSMVDRYIPGSLDGVAWTTLGEACPPLLRRRTSRMSLVEASGSGLRTPALPGLEWCDSPMQAVELGFRRIWPDGGTRRTHQWAASAKINYRSHSWYRLPRWLRVLKVMAGRAPRSATLYTVRQAMQWSAA